MNPSEQKEPLYIYIDGSCLNNQSKKNKCGGYGVFFGDNDPRNVSKYLEHHKITNNILMNVL